MTNLVPFTCIFFYTCIKSVKVCANQCSSCHQRAISIHTSIPSEFTLLFPYGVFTPVYCVTPQLASCQTGAKASLHPFLPPPLQLFDPIGPVSSTPLMPSPIQLSEPRSSLWGRAVKVN